MEDKGFKKIKLIYSGELLIFSILFIVLATLKLLKIWNTSDTRRMIFNILTLAGGTWMIVDFVWATVSKKRRAKGICYLDKILGLPSGLFLIGFDIYCLSQNVSGGSDFYRICISSVFYYIGANYMFQAIYHYFFPLKSLVMEYEKQLKELEEQEKQETLKTQAEQEQEEKPVENNEEN